MTKRVYGPIRQSATIPPGQPGEPYWKVLKVLDEDVFFYVCLFILVHVRRPASPCYLVKWMIHFSWEDIPRDHLRRDKVCLFVAFVWFFGGRGCRFHI